MTDSLPPKTVNVNDLFQAAVAADQAGRPAEAAQLYHAVIKAAPLAEAFRNLGLLLENVGRYPNAQQVYRAGLLANPGDQVCRLQLAFNLLREGEFAEGWPLFEARFDREGMRPKPNLDIPEWDGRPVSSLIVWHEQGLGDQLQLARYVPLLARRSVSVTLLCDPALVRLFQDLPARIVSAENAAGVGGAEAWVMSGSLPGRLGATLDNLPPAAYLPGAAGGVGVGLATRGNPTHPNDANRSLPAGVAARLSALPGVRSLHPEDTGAADMLDTARIISDLDLVISVDTSVAHLAGSMGKTCWVLLPHKPDWRWLRDRTDSPWYPSVRLFRQPARGDWESVVSEVLGALAARQPA